MKRIIWELADGRRVYSSENGRVDNYTDEDIKELSASIVVYGNFAFSKNLLYMEFAIDRIKSGTKDIVEVIDFTLEDCSSPLTDGVLIL
jgi:hypothetical protein